jgi:hypothetical protein
LSSTKRKALAKDGEGAVGRGQTRSLHSDPEQKILHSLYLNLGDRWLVDEVKKFLSMVRHGAKILDPPMIGGAPEDDRDFQIRTWEQHLIATLFRAGQPAKFIVDVFALQLVHDAGMEGPEAMAYTAGRFPHLWQASMMPPGPGTGASPEDGVGIHSGRSEK